MASGTDLTVNSHYKIPWIVWKREVQITVGQYDWSTTEIDHGLPFIPLLIGHWSPNPDFQPSYDISLEEPDYSGAGQPLMALTIAATNSKVRIVLTNNGAQKTFYFRLMAYAPPSYTGEVTPVDYKSPFRFNSHYRYPKIVASGKSSANQVISHNLGYIPQAQIWDSSVVNGVETVIPAPAILATTTIRSTTASAFYYYVFGDRLL